MSKITSSGKIWPYAIGISIVLVFGACIGTIVVASKLPVEKSDTYMMGYHEADAYANDIINARIEFDKKYKIIYINNGINTKNSVLTYKVTDINSNPIDNAQIKVVVTRPNNHKYDQELTNPKVANGLYTFENIKLAEEGRWDVMAKINVDNLERFYNFKADTRTKKISEY